MTVEKCDICKKEIKEGTEVHAAYGAYLVSVKTFCTECGKPIFNFLKKHKFIKTQ